MASNFIKVALISGNPLEVHIKGSGNTLGDVLKAIKEASGKDANPDDHTLFDLGLDSMDMAAVCSALEEVYGMVEQDWTDYWIAKNTEQLLTGSYTNTPRLMAKYIDGIQATRNAGRPNE